MYCGISIHSQIQPICPLRGSCAATRTWWTPGSTGPVPVEVLPWLAVKAGVRMWSSKPDNVRATKAAAMIVAADDGERTVWFPQLLAPAEGGSARKEHRLTMAYREVRIFVSRSR